MSKCNLSELTIAPEDIEWWKRSDGLRHCANPKCRAEIRECMGSVMASDMLKLWKWQENPVGAMPLVRELCFLCAMSCNLEG